jgi:hypothetical protein
VERLSRSLQRQRRNGRQPITLKCNVGEVVLKGSVQSWSVREEAERPHRRTQSDQLEDEISKPIEREYPGAGKLLIW